MDTYSDKLKLPMWQKKRLEILNRDSFTCRACGEDKKQLDVHHIKYIPGREPWEYEDDNFLTLCHLDHQNIELLKKEGIDVCADFTTNIYWNYELFKEHLRVNGEFRR